MKLSSLINDSTETMVSEPNDLNQSLNATASLLITMKAMQNQYDLQPD